MFKMTQYAIMCYVYMKTKIDYIVTLAYIIHFRISGKKKKEKAMNVLKPEENDKLSDQVQRFHLNLN